MLKGFLKAYTPLKVSIKMYKYKLSDNRPKFDHLVKNNSVLKRKIIIDLYTMMTRHPYNCARLCNVMIRHPYNCTSLQCDDPSPLQLF